MSMTQEEYLKTLSDKVLIERSQCKRCDKNMKHKSCLVCQKSFNEIDKRNNDIIYYYANRLHKEFSKYSGLTIKDYASELRFRIAMHLIQDIDTDRLDENYISARQVYLNYCFERKRLNSKYGNKKRDKYKEVSLSEYKETEYIHNAYDEIEKVVVKCDLDNLRNLLTDQEKQVYDMIRKHYKYTEIADEIEATEGRVGQIVSYIRKKIQKVYNS